MKTKQFILMFAAVFLFLSTNPQNAYCQWVDNSDEVQDGIVDLKVPLIIAGGVLVTGAITYLIVKKSKDKKRSSFPNGGETGFLLARSSPIAGGSFYDKMKIASQNSPVEIFTGTPSSGYPMEHNLHSGLAVGLRFKF